MIYLSAQRAQTSTKLSNLNQKWSGIQIRISRLIQIWIWGPILKSS